MAMLYIILSSIGKEIDIEAIHSLNQDLCPSVSGPDVTSTQLPPKGRVIPKRSTIQPPVAKSKPEPPAKTVKLWNCQKPWQLWKLYVFFENMDSHLSLEKKINGIACLDQFLAQLLLRLPYFEGL